MHRQSCVQKCNLIYNSAWKKEKALLCILLLKVYDGVRQMFKLIKRQVLGLVNLDKTAKLTVYFQINPFKEHLP